MEANIILGITANILRTYTIYRFMELLYLPKKKEMKWPLYCLFVILTSGGYYLFYNMYVNIGTNIFGLLLITILYKGRVLKKILVTLCIYSVNIVVESLVFALVIERMKSESIMEGVNECITSIGIFLFVLVLEKTKAVKNNDLQIRLSTWIALFSVPIISIIMILLSLGNYRFGLNLTEIGLIGILIINAVIFYLYGSVQDYYKQKIERDEFLNRVKVYSKQLEIMKNSYANIRELNHDIKHHVTELKYLAHIGDTKKIEKYVGDMEKQLINTDEYAMSGNREIDGTVNYLLQDAKRALKTIKVNISIPENLTIHNYMFNVILGNLLENAICAAKASEKKYLEVEIKSKKKVIYIKITNSFSGEVKLKQGSLVTTKKNMRAHGIGLKHVKKMIDEMDGLLDIKWENDIFYVSVMLYSDLLDSSE